MSSLHLAAIPALVAAVVAFPVALATLLLERGSRRGIGLAGILTFAGVGQVFAFRLHNADPAHLPSHLAARMPMVAGMAALFFLIEMAFDLGRRAGKERFLGLPITVAVFLLRAIAIVGFGLVLLTRLLLRGAAPEPLSGWRYEWGPFWPIFAVGVFLYIGFAAACWDAERRRRQGVDGELLCWAAAFVFVFGLPALFGLVLPPLGIAREHVGIGISVTVGAIVTLVGLVQGRDLELRRLRKLAARSQGDGALATGSSGHDTAPQVIACKRCGAVFESLGRGVCPLDGAPLEVCPDPLIGQVLDRRYRVLHFLGSGGMARVYAAEHARLGVRLAIKVLWGEQLGDARMSERFMREARAASRLSNRHIVRVQDVGEVRAGQPYLAMELCEGQPLERMLAREGPLVPESVALLGAQLAEGLSAAHREGVIHRDLKPENIMIVRGADRDQARIVDFGLARLVKPGEETRLTKTGAVFGTALYMAPEQARGSAVGPPADLYALGVVLFEAAAGDVPFTGSSPVQVLVQQLEAEPPPMPIEGELADIVRQLLHKQPEARADSAEALADRFRRLAGDACRFVPRGPPPKRALPAAADTLVDPAASR